MTFQPRCKGPIPKGNCQWCGRKLRPHMTYTFTDAQGKMLARSIDRPSGHFGYYGDDHFCGMSCGYQFAAFVADRGVTQQS